MCIVAIAWQLFDQLPLVVLSNRDEFLNRPTLPAHQWADKPIFAGRDEMSGGTWLGHFSPANIPQVSTPQTSTPQTSTPQTNTRRLMTPASLSFDADSLNPYSLNDCAFSNRVTNTNNRWAAVLNFRDAEPTQPEYISRGRLVTDFLSSDISPMNFARQITLNDYAGFNLVIGDDRQALLVNNRGYPPTSLHAGLHVISNGQPDSEWAKCERLRTRICQELIPLIAQGIDEAEWQSIAFDILSDKLQADDEQLPKTGMPLELEKALSSIFIEHGRLPNYGTRTQSIMTLGLQDTEEVENNISPEPIARFQLISKN